MSTTTIQQLLASTAKAVLHGEGSMSLKPAWDACLSQADTGSQFATYGWHRAWMDTIGTRPPWTGTACVLTAENEYGKTIGILPLARARKFGLNILSLAGYFQPIRTPIWAKSHEGEAAQALAARLGRGVDHWHILRLGPVDLENAGNRALLEQLRIHSPLIEIRPMSANIVVPRLPASFAEYQSEILGNTTSQRIRRYERSLIRIGGMKMRRAHNPGGDQLEGYLQDCRRIEARSWIANATQPYLRFSTDLDLEFWRRATAEASASGNRVSFWVMDFSGQPIAFYVTVAAAGVLYLIACQFDESFAKYGPGKVIHLRVFEEACASGLRAADFGGENLHFKSLWGGRQAGNRGDVLVFSPSISGRCLARIRRVMQSGRQVVRSIRLLKTGRDQIRDEQI